MTLTSGRRASIRRQKWKQGDRCRCWKILFGEFCVKYKIIYISFNTEINDIEKLFQVDCKLIKRNTRKLNTSYSAGFCAGTPGERPAFLCSSAVNRGARRPCLSTSSVTAPHAATASVEFFHVKRPSDLSQSNCSCTKQNFSASNKSQKVFLFFTPRPAEMERK